MAWGERSALIDRFVAARAVWADRVGGKTYQGFVKALTGRGLNMVRYAADGLRRRLLTVGGAYQRRFGFVALAVDGSRFELSRTAAHERVFGLAGKANASPQLWITTLWHMGLGLPWDWRVGRAASSERGHLRAMLEQTPEESLIVAAGQDPLSWSVAASLRAVRNGLRTPRRPIDWPTSLSRAVKDPYPRRRKVRQHWPRKKHADPPPGPPRLRQATPREIALCTTLTTV